ncbi:MAG TPA: FAD:protein FMN transferase [Thermoanaerobaculia bacterium]|nr:FAD:protein FMN transferase [Thermoanaerobaculia bacterium]
MTGWLLLAAFANALLGAPATGPDEQSPRPPASAPRPTEAVLARRLASMGTTLDLTVLAVDRPAAVAASERAVEALEAAERRLSTWRDDTELAAVNRAPVGAPVPLSKELARDLAAALDCARETGGAFDPTVGALVAAWGLRHGGRHPSDPEIEAALRATGFASLSVDPQAAPPVAIRRLAGLAIEEGGFGKGAGLADAIAALSQAPGARAALLDLGGQVAVWESPGKIQKTPWKVAIADPDRRNRPVLEVVLGGGSLSTSGNGERGMMVGGERIGHILDPRTGRPAPDFGSLTVFAADPLRADCLSTGLFVLGPEAALAFAAAHPGVEVIALVRDPSGRRLTARVSSGLAGRIKTLAPDGVKLEIARPGAKKSKLSGGPVAPRGAAFVVAGKQNRRGAGPWVAPWRTRPLP